MPIRRKILTDFPQLTIHKPLQASKNMEESIIFEILNKSKTEKELIGIWQYDEGNGFLIGYVVDFNEDMVLFQHYTKYGKEDGITILQTDGIQNIDFDDEYVKAMECLIKYSDIIHTQPEIKLHLNLTEDWQSELIQQMVKNSETIISLEINDSYYSGYVTRASESDFVLRCVGKMGEDEGNVVYRIEDVTEFKIQDLDDRKKDLLYKWRKASL